LQYEQQRRRLRSYTRLHRTDCHDRLSRRRLRFA
jgi:hypothetical protein